MSQLLVRRAHALSPADAQARVARLAAELGRRFGAACRWQGDVLWIEHASVNGTVAVHPSEIVVEARLALPLSLLRRRAEQEITRILDREFGA
jgi:putative polyhydroxyalkanoate system protein